MTSVVSLPKTPHQLPGNLPLSEIFTDNDASLPVAKEYLSRLAKPAVIAGSAETPANWWLAAQIEFPDVEKLLYQADGSWIKILPNGSDTISHGPTAEHRKTSDNLNHKPATITDAGSIKAEKFRENSTANNKTPSELVRDTYLNFAWCLPKAESVYERHLRQAESNSPSDRQLISRIKKAAKDGKRAGDLTNTLKKKLNYGESADEVRAWIDSISESEPDRIINSLNRALQKDTDFKAKKRSHRGKNQSFKIELPHIQLINGRHPQSLRELTPSKSWEIYIDETGNIFDAGAQFLNESDKDLGRIIAVAMPAGHGMPELPTGTHAADLPLADIQSLLQTLSTSNIGILGATLKSDIRSQTWIAAITKMVRWTLVMLPISGPTRVIFKIERKDHFQESATLLALEDTLADELTQLAPKRFKNLDLSLEIMSKEDPLNGYVDVIANCWGSRDSAKAKLMKHTRWRGHCLIETHDLAEIDRLYQKADEHMDSNTWFSICDAVAKETGHSIFHDLLTELGERTQKDTKLWQKYLHEIRQRIALKDFNTGSLNRAIEWLNLYRPETASLPGLIKLQLKSAQLAAANHLGKCDITQMAEVMALANNLMDESAPDACQAALRIAISATNSFDFNSVVPYIQDLASQPISIPGRLNHGKLLSTLGQLAAFRGEHEQALKYIDQALIQFERLSDSSQATGNLRQTGSYRAIVQIDMDATGTAEAVRKIADESTKKTGVQSIRRLARSGSLLRFEHYLLLRWLTHRPEEAQLRKDYLETIEEWQFGEGHPWMLINAYRAWLLADSERADEAASYLQKAIDVCEEAESNAILHWMAHCLHALGGSLGLVLDQPARKCPTAPFPAEELVKLRKANTTGERVTALNTLLPFNFH
jgi:tetratricopeptide (TPR) repeat protein